MLKTVTIITYMVKTYAMKLNIIWFRFALSVLCFLEEIKPRQHAASTAVKKGTCRTISLSM